MNSLHNTGKFIVFEGIDGSGKGTQLKRCVEFLFDLNKENDIYITREPTRDFKQIREVMKQSTDYRQEAEWYAEMFVKDRHNHLEKYIKPSLERGTHVLCDRFKHSTLAYQHTQGMDLDMLIRMHEGMIIPDLTFIFDCDVEIAFERRHKDVLQKPTDVFEKDIAFQKELRNNYHKIQRFLSERNENVIIIDANRSVIEIGKDIQKHLTLLFSQVI